MLLELRKPVDNACHKPDNVVRVQSSCADWSNSTWIRCKKELDPSRKFNNYAADYRSVNTAAVYALYLATKEVSATVVGRLT